MSPTAIQMWRVITWTTNLDTLVPRPFSTQVKGIPLAFASSSVKSHQTHCFPCVSVASIQAPAPSGRHDRGQKTGFPSACTVPTILQGCCLGYSHVTFRDVPPSSVPSHGRDEVGFHHVHSQMDGVHLHWQGPLFQERTVAGFLL